MKSNIHKNTYSQMEQKYKAVSIFEFARRFPDNRTCLEHLANSRWGNGFVCPKCGHTHFCRGINELDRQCTSCRRLVSPTSGTLFHRNKFPLLKAFYIIYYVVTNPKGISSAELSRRLDLPQKTCWAFKQRVTRELSSVGTRPFAGIVESEHVAIQRSLEDVENRKIV